MRSSDIYVRLRPSTLRSPQGELVFPLVVPRGTTRGGILMAIVDLITSGLGLLASEKDITTTWVDGVLRGSGHLEDGVTVTAVTTERIGEGVGILSILQRVIPTYSGATKAPKSIVVKYPTDDPVQRGTADALVFYIRELTFYRDCAPSAPFKTAKCYGQAIESENTNFTIAMEDISHYRALNQIEGVSLSDAKIMLEKLADFHAMWWNSPKLPAMQSIFPPMTNPTYEMVIPMLWTQGWPNVIEHAGHLLPDSVRSIGDIYAAKVPWMLSNMMEPMTLVHGDYRADNMMFDGNEPVVIDYQIVGTGSGMYDVGYFIGQSIATDVRRGHDRELVDLYLDRLETHGITIDRDEMWRQYLVVLVWCVNYGVITFSGFAEQNERGQHLLQDMLLRAMHCVADNDALKVIS
jgi:thiamine kinase-like enzyme